MINDKTDRMCAICTMCTSLVVTGGKQVSSVQPDLGLLRLTEDVEQLARETQEEAAALQEEKEEKE